MGKLPGRLARKGATGSLRQVTGFAALRKRTVHSKAVFIFKACFTERNNIFENHKRRKIMQSNFIESSFLRLPQVLAIIPISKSAWWQGCKSGLYTRAITSF
jgi:hypothetical protein